MALVALVNLRVVSICLMKSIVKVIHHRSSSKNPPKKASFILKVCTLNKSSQHKPQRSYYRQLNRRSTTIYSGNKPTCTSLCVETGESPYAFAVRSNSAEDTFECLNGQNLHFFGRPSTAHSAQFFVSFRAVATLCVFYCFVSRNSADSYPDSLIVF